VLIGVFIGAMMSFLFCGLTMNAVGRAAQSMVEEVRRQFREIKGILTGEGTPDYARCVAISTRGAQREMLFPSLLAIAAPVVVGLVFGVAGVMGLLVGGLSSGFVLAVFMANAGGAWDNAKKMVEEGHFGGKGSDCHRATVVGDTVGDPFKDTRLDPRKRNVEKIKGQKTLFDFGDADLCLNEAGHGRRDEEFGLECGLLVEERREEQACQRRQHGDDRNAVGQREVGVPDFRQQRHLFHALLHRLDPRKRNVEKIKGQKTLFDFGDADRSWAIRSAIPSRIRRVRRSTFSSN